MIRKLAKNNLLLFLTSLSLSFIGSSIIINQTNAYLEYDNYMKFILITSAIVTTFSLVKIFFTRFNKLYKYLFFIGYCGFIYVFLFCRGGDLASDSNFNFNLFAYNELNPHDHLAFKLSIFNILLFLPFGCVYYKTKALNFLSIIIFIILCVMIEYLQVVEHVGVFDVTDILLYIIGFFLGRVIRNIFLRLRFRY